MEKKTAPTDVGVAVTNTEPTTTSLAHAETWLKILLENGDLELGTPRFRKDFIDWATSPKSQFLRAVYKGSILDGILEHLIDAGKGGERHHFIVSFSGSNFAYSNDDADAGELLMSLRLELAAAMGQRGLRSGLHLRRRETFKNLLKELPHTATVWCLVEDTAFIDRDDPEAWGDMCRGLRELERLTTLGPGQRSSEQGCVLKVLFAHRGNTDSDWVEDETS